MLLYYNNVVSKWRAKKFDYIVAKVNELRVVMFSCNN